MKTLEKKKYIHSYEEKSGLLGLITTLTRARVITSLEPQKNNKNNGIICCSIKR